jgi:hypothetical protein
MTARDSRLVTLALALLLGGCGAGFARQRVPADELAKLAAAGRESIVLRDVDGKAVRVDARSRLRFHTRDGHVTEWVAAKDLSVFSDAIAREVRVRPRDPSLADAVAVRVAALDASSRALLTGGLPAEFVTVLADGTVEVRGQGALGLDWLRGFLLAVAHARAPGLADGAALAALHGELARTFRLDGAALGRWSFLVPPADQFRPALDGAELLDALDGAIYLRGGALMADVASVDVENLSGARTFGITVAAIAVSVILIPVLALGRADPGAVGESPADDAPDAQAERRTAGAAPASDLLGARLLSPAARRRAIVRLVPTLEIGADPLASGWLMDAATFGVRLFEVFELGGGARHLRVPLAGGGPRSRAMGFARLQGHFDLDARRRFALALGLDVGGGGDVTVQARVALSFRVRVARQLFAGVFLFNPTYTLFAGPSTRAASGFTFPSGVELGAAF